MRRGIKRKITSSKIRRVIAMTSTSLAVACGGAPFQLGYIDAGRDVVGVDVVENDTVVDAGRDVKLMLHHDASADVDDTSDEVAVDAVVVVDAKKEADAIETSLVCTPVMPTATICGSNQAVVAAPQAYCWLTGFGSMSTSGEARAMPQGCRCQETYDCGCLLATGISCTSSMALHCSLSNGIVVVSCT